MSVSDPQANHADQSGERRVAIVYDGGCPFCSAYVRLVRLRDAVGPVELMDARRGGPLVDEIAAAGYDLDDGMVLKLNGVLYHGDECLNRLAFLSTGSGVFNRLMAFLFSRPAAARIAYPFLRAGRNLALRLMGRRKLDIAKPKQPV
ncbi:DCC1-like thiol-disulfide oxidoreductase family protein [Mesorhizobium sp. KR9-304]|uniref:DCC1-like thiol-disulfide oxidoreductase family protein n=1 Tax=Mesorhizobium sp. KR9-304 TaxID=3156614 RepID=UPI0032B37EBA